MDSQASTAAMIEDYLRALMDEHRRKLLLVLVNRNEHEGVSVPETVAQDGDDLTTLRIEFHHMHLPRLEELGLVDWNRETDVVTRGANFETLQPLVEFVGTFEESIEDSR